VKYKTCPRCGCKFVPLEKRKRIFCWTCTNSDMLYSYLAYGKTYEEFVPFSGRDQKPPADK
jgi:uncharacterized Zn finger protein (UPF0148 family)